MRKDVAVWESVRERDLAAERRKRDERAEEQHAQRWAKRWGESLPRECEGAGSARARGMVLRARIWEGVGGREEEGEGQSGRVLNTDIFMNTCLNTHIFYIQVEYW